MKELHFEQMYCIDGGCSGRKGLFVGVGMSLLGLAALANPVAGGIGAVVLIANNADCF